MSSDRLSVSTARGKSGLLSMGLFRLGPQCGKSRPLRVKLLLSRCLQRIVISPRQLYLGFVRHKTQIFGLSSPPLLPLSCSMLWQQDLLPSQRPWMSWAQILAGF